MLDISTHIWILIHLYVCIFEYLHLNRRIIFGDAWCMENSTCCAQFLDPKMTAAWPSGENGFKYIKSTSTRKWPRTMAKPSACQTMKVGPWLNHQLWMSNHWGQTMVNHSWWMVSVAWRQDRSRRWSAVGCSKCRWQRARRTWLEPGWPFSRTRWYQGSTYRDVGFFDWAYEW